MTCSPPGQPSAEPTKKMVVQFVVGHGDQEVPFAVGTEPFLEDELGDDGDDNDSVNELYSIGEAESLVGSEAIRAGVFYSQWAPLIEQSDWEELELAIEDCPQALYSQCAIMGFEMIVEHNRSQQEPEQLRFDPIVLDLLKRVVKKLCRMYGVHNVVSRCLVHMEDISCSIVMLSILLDSGIATRQQICDSLHWTETFFSDEEGESTLDKPFLRALIQERMQDRWDEWSTELFVFHFDVLLQKTSLWLATAYDDGEDGTVAATTLKCPSLTLHRMAGTACANMAIFVASKTYPTQAAIVDEHGRLPLHYAVRHLTHHSIVVEDEPDFEEYPFNRIPATKQLVTAYPEGARVPGPDDQRLPLHTAITTGYGVWEKQYHLRYYHPGEEQQQQRGPVGFIPHCLDSFNALISAAPDVLQQQDPQTGLYPFLLARNTSVDLIYTLLRECPTMVEIGVVDDR